MDVVKDLIANTRKIVTQVMIVLFAVSRYIGHIIISLYGRQGGQADRTSNVST